MDCLFCKIAKGEIKSDIIFENSDLLAFKDIHPKAPHHVLIIPRKHIATLNDIQSHETELLGNMMQTAKKIASDLGIAEKGYRVLMNCNKEGGQEIYHIHLHLMGGRSLKWPPG